MGRLTMLARNLTDEILHCKGVGSVSAGRQLSTSFRSFDDRAASTESGRNLAAVLLQWNGDLWGRKRGLQSN
jgi:hypothetical protein